MGPASHAAWAGDTPQDHSLSRFFISAGLSAEPCASCRSSSSRSPEDEAEEDASPSRRKKPYRLRWPAEVHDEVLARLLDLNQKRAQAEFLSGAHAEPKSAKAAPKPRSPRKPKGASATPSLFPSDADKKTP